MGFVDIPALDGKPLIGRDADLDEVVGWLRDHERLITLVGTGGIGKTLLAQHAVHRMDGAGYQEIRWIGLDSISTEGRTRSQLRERVLATIAHTLGVTERPALDALARHLRDSGQRILIVLDNCEHVEEAAGHIVSRLLTDVPLLSVLATSQRVLGLGAERQYELRPLSVPAGDDADVDQYDAIRLLVTRTLDRDLTFELTAKNRSQIAKLARAVEGVPLALLLCSGELAWSTPESVLRDMDSHGILATLGGGDPHGKPTHTNLRLTIGWMWELATKEERYAWAVLSMLPGGFTFDLAVAVLTEPSGEGAADGELTIAATEVRPLLRRLVGRSIITRTTRDSRARYTLLRTLREQGQEKIAGLTDPDEIRRRVLSHFHTLSAEATSAWFGPDELLWLRRWRAEKANLDGSLAYAEAHDPRLGLELQMNLLDSRGGVYEGLLAEAAEWIERLLAALPEHDDNAELVANALATVGWLRCLRGEPDAAAEAFAQCRRFEPAEGLPTVTRLRGIYAWWGSNDHHTALELLHQAAKEFGDSSPARRHHAHVYAALCCAFHGSLDHAARLVEHAVGEARDSGGPWALSWAQYGQAVLLMRRADEDPQHRTTLLAQAKDLVDGIAAMWRDIRDRWSPAWGLAAEAWILSRQGRHELAVVLLGGAQRVGEQGNEHVTELPGFRDFNEAVFTAARTRLGSDAVERARIEGRARGEQALDYALYQAYAAEADLLTTAERETIKWLPTGFNNTEIGRELGKSHRTVESTIASARKRLDIDSRDALTEWVVRSLPEALMEPPAPVATP